MNEVSRTLSADIRGPRITIQQAAELLELDEWSVRCLAEAGTLPYVVEGGVWALSLRSVFDHGCALARAEVTVQDALRAHTRATCPDVAEALDAGDVAAAAARFLETLPQGRVQ